MAKNNKEYGEKREEEKLNKGIKDCNKLAKDLQSHYKLAYKEIEKEINNLFKKYNLLDNCLDSVYIIFNSHAIICCIYIYIRSKYNKSFSIKGEDYE